jgi:hypothetical protein
MSIFIQITKDSKIEKEIIQDILFLLSTFFRQGVFINKIEVESSINGFKYNSSTLISTPKTNTASSLLAYILHETHKLLMSL